MSDHIIASTNLCVSKSYGLFVIGLFLLVDWPLARGPWAPAFLLAAAAGPAFPESGSYKCSIFLVLGRDQESGLPEPGVRRELEGHPG